MDRRPERLQGGGRLDRPSERLAVFQKRHSQHGRCRFHGIAAMDAGCWMLDAGTQIAATVPLAFLCRRAHQPASPPAHLVVVVVVAGVGRGRAETVCSALCSLLAPASDRHGLTRAATGDHGGMASAPGRPAGPTTPKSEREREPGGGVSRQMMALRASFRYTARHSLRLRRRSTAAQQSEWEPWCCSSTQSSP